PAQHRLLSDAFPSLLTAPMLPAEYLPEPAEPSIQLIVDQHNHARIQDVWGGGGAPLPPSSELGVTAALDAFPGQPTAPAVTRIEALAAPIPNPAVLARR